MVCHAAVDASCHDRDLPPGSPLRPLRGTLGFGIKVQRDSSDFSVTINTGTLLDLVKSSLKVPNLGPFYYNLSWSKHMDLPGYLKEARRYLTDHPEIASVTVLTPKHQPRPPDPGTKYISFG